MAWTKTTPVSAREGSEDWASDPSSAREVSTSLSLTVDPSMLFDVPLGSGVGFEGVWLRDIPLPKGTWDKSVPESPRDG